MSPADLQKMINAGETPSNADLAGHIVTGFSWRFYAVCSADLAERLNGLSRVSTAFRANRKSLWLPLWWM